MKVDSLGKYCTICFLVGHLQMSLHFSCTGNQLFMEEEGLGVSSTDKISLVPLKILMPYFYSCTEPWWLLNGLGIRKESVLLNKEQNKPKRRLQDFEGL